MTAPASGRAAARPVPLPTGLPVQRPLLGIGLILLSCAAFALLDSASKTAVAALPVVVVVWARYAVQAVAMGVWLLHPARRHLLPTHHPRFQLLRGGLLVTVTALAVLSLQYLPVAEFTAIVMLTPVIVTVIAVVVLKEAMTPLRWALAAGGLAGALIIARPGSGLFGWAALLPAIGATCYAAFQLLTRRMAALESPLTTHFYTGVVGTAAASAALVALAVPFGTVLAEAGPRLGALLLLLGALGTVGHLMLILAMGMAPVSTLMPFTYAQILFATVAGWLVFGHVPDTAALAGMGIIAVCGAAAVWLNARPGGEANRARVPDNSVSADTIAD